MPWHCCAVGCCRVQGGRGPVGAAIRLCGWVEGSAEWMGPSQEPSQAAPPIPVYSVSTSEPCRTPDMCFHLAQTMTRPVLGCEWMRLSPDTDLSPVPPTDLALASARGLGTVQHLAHGTQESLAATLGASWPQSMTAAQPSLALCLAISPGLTRPPSPAPAVAPGLCRWLSLLPAPLSPGLKHPWAPALSTALPSEQQHQCLRRLDQQESCCCWSLCRPEPHSGAGSLGSHLQVSSSIPVLLVLSPAMCSLQAQSGFGPGLAAQFCCFFSSWCLNVSITSPFCE